ncbi:unnamed protein product [Lampetra planeri]
MAASRAAASRAQGRPIRNVRRAGARTWRRRREKSLRSPGSSLWLAMAGFLQRVASSLLCVEARLLQMLGFHHPPAPVLVFPTLSGLEQDSEPEISFLDNPFLWMAAPKNRRTIERNHDRRRNPQKMIKFRTNVDMCPECGNLKLKHVLCGFCYDRVMDETRKIRALMAAQEDGPLRAPATETVVVYEGENTSETDAGKRILETKRKRPNWFTLH